jgi:hypothetical protein
MPTIKKSVRLVTLRCATTYSSDCCYVTRPNVIPAARVVSINHCGPNDVDNNHFQELISVDLRYDNTNLAIGWFTSDYFFCRRSTSASLLLKSYAMSARRRMETRRVLRPLMRWRRRQRRGRRHTTTSSYIVDHAVSVSQFEAGRNSTECRCSFSTSPKEDLLIWTGVSWYRIRHNVVQTALCR